MSDAVDQINRKFKSGNDVPVERAWVTAEEWEAAKREIKAESVQALLSAWEEGDEGERWYTISPEWVREYANQIRSGER